MIPFETIKMLANAGAFKLCGTAKCNSSSNEWYLWLGLGVEPGPCHTGDTLLNPFAPDDRPSLS